jgi:hypothetical protein
MLVAYLKLISRHSSGNTEENGVLKVEVVGYVLPKYRYIPTSLDNITSQKTNKVILTAMRKLNFFSETFHRIIQRDETSGPRATSNQGPLVARPDKLFVHLLLVSTSSFIVFTPKDLGKMTLITYNCHTCH